ncbi:MAG: hypothetical protein H6553_07065 [Chitinophagales bacterium]|nr:hypothetical protein [Chitinophagales bacterium]
MKSIKLFSVLFFLVVAFSISNAQSQFVVNEIRQTMSKGTQNGFEVPLTGTSVDDAKSGFEKWAKGYKAKVTSSKKSSEIFVDNALFKTVSSNTVDMYATVVPDGNGSKVLVFVDLGGAFISSAAYPQQYAAMEGELRKFAQEQAVNLIEDQLKTEEKNLKTLESDLSKLQKDKENSIKDIEQAKALIIQREQEIQQNDADQLAKQQQINLQQQIVDTIKMKKAQLK